MPTDVVLVRHALSVPMTDGGPDEFTRPLTPDGLRQAHDLVPVLTGLGPSAVWSSPYRRAAQTVQPAARVLGLSVRTLSDLREWDDGLAYIEDWEPHHARSWADTSAARATGESLDQVTARAVDAVRELVRRHPGQVVLAASHGTLIARALAGFGVSMDWAAARRMPMPAVYRLRFADPGTDPVVTPGGRP